MKLRPLNTEHLSLWHVAGATVMGALGVTATWPIWQHIYRTATNMANEENSQVLLVPFVVAWLVWVRRSRIRHCKPSGTLIGPLLILLGWAMSSMAYYKIGFYRNIQSLYHLGAIIVVVGCVLSVLGKNVFFRFFPAFLVLIFLIPVPGTLREKIALPLQTYLAQISQFLLEMLGVDALRTGNQLTINGVPVEIAEACNGMRMVFALILVVYVFAFGLPLRNSVRVLLLLLSPLAAMVCNIIRILPTAYVFGYMSEDFAHKFHNAAGWVMLPLAFGMLYGIIQLLRWAMIPVQRYTLAAQ